MSKVITIAQQKGGSGKTTIAANLATVFSLKNNLSTTLLDTDPQGSLGKWFMTRQEKLKEKNIDVTNYLKIVQLNGTVNLDPFKIEYITLTHSILEPNGLRIETPAGVILHTGDWKIDPEPLLGEKINSNRLKENGKEGL